MTPQHRVYVIQNPEGRFYTGLTDNLWRRIEQHNGGVSQWTKGRGPWRLRWVSDQLSLGEARKLENALKRQKGGAGFYKMTGLSRS